MLKFNIPPTPDTTELTTATLNRVNLTGVYEAERELQSTIFDRQRGHTGEEVIAFIGESCGRIIRGNGGLESEDALIGPINEYVEVLTSDWSNERAIAIFHKSFLSGAIDEGIYGTELIKQPGVAA